MKYTTNFFGTFPVEERVVRVYNNQDRIDIPISQFHMKIGEKVNLIGENKREIKGSIVEIVNYDHHVTKTVRVE